MQANYLIDQLQHNYDLASITLGVGLLKERRLFDLFESEVRWT